MIWGLLSPIIVLRRLSFAADGLAHASLGGLAIGLSLFSSGALPGVAEYLFAIVFTCGFAAAMAFFARRVQSNTAIGACYAAALLVLPGAAGCLMSRRLMRVLSTSTFAALASSAGGMVWSNSADIPPGAAIVLCLFAHFVGAYGFHRWREHRAAGQAAKTSVVRPQTENLEAFSK